MHIEAAAVQYLQSQAQQVKCFFNLFYFIGYLFYSELEVAAVPAITHTQQVRWFVSGCLLLFDRRHTCSPEDETNWSVLCSSPSKKKKKKKASPQLLLWVLSKKLYECLRYYSTPSSGSGGSSCAP